MTADEIIAANPEYQYKPADIGGMKGLKGRHPETGAEHWCVFAGTTYIMGPGPWDDERIKAAALSLSASAGHIDRAPHLTRPTNRKGAQP
jgi:hypothetical protein